MSSTSDLLDRLSVMLGDLNGYIDRRAAELAKPVMDAALEDAKAAIDEARAETQRQEDLVRELRRRMVVLERARTTGFISDLRQLAEGCRELAADPDLDKVTTARLAYRTVARDIMACIGEEG